MRNFYCFTIEKLINPIIKFLKFLTSIEFLAKASIVIGGATIAYLLLDVSRDGYVVFEKIKIDYQVTGQFGDFVGGVVGTLFALGGTLLIFLTFEAQTKQNQREAFEATFFEMIRLHRENVSELNYKKFDPKELIFLEKEVKKGAMGQSMHKKVFRILVEEFKYCYDEVEKIINLMPNKDEILLENYKIYLASVIKKRGVKASVMEIVKVDIAYSVFYYGLHREGKQIVELSFANKYRRDFSSLLISLLVIKPKQEDGDNWDKWRNVFNVNENLKKKFEETRSNLQETNSTKDDWSNLNYSKYYGGQQHRLGHYFRHLFQSFTYVFEQDWMDRNTKYRYGKMLRAQMSTYEQSMLFINSLSTIGMKWELDCDLFGKDEDQVDKELITYFGLIKNLPGLGLYQNSLIYLDYYPKVKFESREQKWVVPSSLSQ